MQIILGGTGAVGSAVARALLKRKEPVTIVTRNAGHAADLREAGAVIAEASIRDVTALRKIFQSGSRAFLLSPPAAPATDTDAVELANVTAIIEALAASGLEKVVAASTYGAHRGQRCGDLTVLHAFEEKLRAQPIPAAINRGAYYMSNWIGMRERGKLTSFLPADLKIPMVAPNDVGEAAAQRLLSPVSDTGLRYVEGPCHYSPNDVATAFSTALGMPVEVETIPRHAWESTFRAFGFSNKAAVAYACMTAKVVDGEIETPDDPLHGSTSLHHYIRYHVASRLHHQANAGTAATGRSGA